MNLIYGNLYVVLQLLLEYKAEAVKAMIAYVRDHFGAAHFASSHAEPNLASGHVMKKCGLKFVGYGEFQKLDGSLSTRHFKSFIIYKLPIKSIFH